MIIKLAIFEEDYEKTLTAKEKAKYQAMRLGAGIGGTTLAGKEIGHFENRLKPGVGSVRRFLTEKNILIPRLKDTVKKWKWTPGQAARMGAIGVLGGGILGLGIHEAKLKVNQLKNRHK